MHPMNRLCGQTLLAIDEVGGSIWFGFTDCSLEAMNPVTCTPSLRALVGSQVQAVEFTRGDALVLRFSSGGTCSISLRQEDYLGGEAFCANFKGLNVVE